MMNFDLTVQFVRDYEELRERMERQPGAVEAAPTRELLDEIDRLRQQISQLEARAHEETARESDETARGLEESIRRLASSHEAESRKAQALVAAKDRALEELRSRCSALSKSLDDLKESQALDLGRGEETIRQPSGELAAGPRELKGRMAGPAARRPDADAWQVARTRDADVKALRIQILAEFESRLERVIHLPLKLRLAAIVLDLLLLAIAVNLLVNSDPSRTEPANLPTFVVAVLAVFSLRTFLSPGRMLLGISPRQIGHGLKPIGPAGLPSRFFCGILHYAPMIIAAHYAASDPRIVAALSKLSRRVFDPESSGLRLPEIAHELFREAAPLPAVLLALAMAWWGVLLLSILISPLLHRSTPYFRNTTIIESICGVGFQRFPWPRWATDEIE
jgi:hypothetical protein